MNCIPPVLPGDLAWRSPAELNWKQYPDKQRRENDFVMNHYNSSQPLLTSKGMIQERAIVFSHLISAQLQRKKCKTLKGHYVLIVLALTF